MFLFSSSFEKKGRKEVVKMMIEKRKDSEMK
jgi:hypothetical protein